MNRYFLMFLIFSLISLAAVGISLYDSPAFSLSGTKAEGFGISPPYFKDDNLRPGQIYSQAITILRSSAARSAWAEIKIEAPDAGGWIKAEPEGRVELPAGKISVPVRFTAYVPEDARFGDYRGRIYFTILSDEKKSGVGVRVGALAEIFLTVKNNSEKKLSVNSIAIADYNLYSAYQGRFVKPLFGNDIFYLMPAKERALIINKESAIDILKNEATGITADNLFKIPPGLRYLKGADSDKDDLPDDFEDALGTDKNSPDTDSDGFPDGYELANGYSPIKKYEALPIDLEFTKRQAGRIFLNTGGKGEFWYVNPSDLKRYFLAREGGWDVLFNIAQAIEDDELNRLFGR